MNFECSAQIDFVLVAKDKYKDFAVSFKSFSPGTGLAKYKALFIFDASNTQFDTPINPIFLFSCSRYL